MIIFLYFNIEYWIFLVPHVGEPTIILPPSLVQILPLADVYFRCRARASPNRSVIEWSHSNPDITPTRVFYEESERADGSVVSNSTFIIENVTGKDSGRVKCKASMMYNGQVFETEREATLNVFGELNLVYTEF